MVAAICDLRVKIALTAKLCKNIELSHSTGPVGAAGAQVPYKHKVTGSNPVPATRKDSRQGRHRGHDAPTQRPKRILCHNKTQASNGTAKRVPPVLHWQKVQSGGQTTDSFTRNKRELYQHTRAHLLLHHK